MNMTEYKINNATVRIHGEADKENIKAATERFLKQIEKKKKEKQK